LIFRRLVAFSQNAMLQTISNDWAGMFILRGSGKDLLDGVPLK
jgi:hypothetical protein